MTRPFKAQNLALLMSLAIIGQGWAHAQEAKQDDSALESYLHSSNPHLRKHAYVLLASKWPNPHLFVCWENPSDQYQHAMSLVEEEVQETWALSSQLTFTGWEKCAVHNKGIHILVDDSGPRTQYLGRRLDGLTNGMVLNFTFEVWGQQCQKTLDYCIKGIAGHEFGHAIGFAHEQNRPDKPGECMEPPSGQNGDASLTPYDTHSIMNYCNSRYNNDGHLSTLDVDAVRILYGSPTPTRGMVP
jgi:hypothetical protein